MLKIYHKYLLSKGYNLVITADTETFEKNGKTYWLKEREDTILYLEDTEGEQKALPEEILLSLEDAVLEMTASDRLSLNICGQKNIADLTVYCKENIRYAADLIDNSIYITVGKERRKLQFLTLKEVVSFVLDRQQNGDWVEKAIIQGAA